jgi:hypothetical protein
MPNAPQTPPTTHDGQALIKGAKAGLLIAIGIPLVCFAFVGGAIGIWASIGVHLATQSSLAFFGTFAAVAVTTCGSLALGQYACKRGAAAYNAVSGYGVTKMVGAIVAPTTLAFGLALAAPYVTPAPIKDTFNAIAQKRDAAKRNAPQNAQEKMAPSASRDDHTNTDKTAPSGPSDHLVYVLESKDCDSESAKELERFMADQKTAFICLPKFVP